MTRSRSARHIFAIILVLLAGCRRERGESGTPLFQKAPVIVISIDTLRSDHLPAYGYKGVETPAIDRFRKDAILFQHAYSHCPLTLPSHVSMLSGLLPAESGVRNNIGFRFDPSLHPTISSTLEASGYRTGAAVSAYVLRGETGLRTAFDFYDDGVEVRTGASLGSLERPGGETVAVASKWIGENREHPFFFLLHLFEPHTPYTAPAAFSARFKNPYDAEIAETDAIVGSFLERLRRLGLYDKAIIIILSDHGEGLMDHGEDEHGIFLYREAIQIPLLLKLPSGVRAGSTVANPVQLIDLFPTIARLTGTAVPANLTGASLLEADAHPSRRIFSETIYPRIHLGWSELRSLIDDKHHFIDAPRAELYSPRTDPRETMNTVTEERRVVASMKTTMEPFSKQIAASRNVDPQEIDKLTALGYLGRTAPESSGALPDPKDRIGEISAMKEASRFTAAKNYDQAIARFKEVLDANPNFTDAWVYLGRTSRTQSSTRMQSWLTGKRLTWLRTLQGRRLFQSRPFTCV